MKRITILMATLVAFWTATAYAATPQQRKMKTCNAEAAKQNLKGDERKAFMSDCLSGRSTGAGLTPQRERMKSCNADATSQGLKGATRKKFMSECLAKEPAKAAEPASPAPTPDKATPPVPTPVPTPGTTPVEPSR